MPDWARLARRGEASAHGERYNDLLTMRRNRRLACGGSWGLTSGTCRGSAVVDGVVEVLFQGLRAVLMCRGGKILDVYLDSLSRDSHGIALNYPRWSSLDTDCRLWYRCL